jgi:hypothetical protein
MNIAALLAKAALAVHPYMPHAKHMVRRLHPIVERSTI